MKLNRILFAALMASVTGSSITSCSESFLDENLTTQYSTDRFKTQEGLDELVTGAYQKLKFKFNYIWGIQCYNMGVDEFTDANNVIPAWNHYSQDLNSSENAANQPIWDNYYGLVEPANILIQNIPQYYNQSSPTYNTRLGEAHFLRAYAYFELVKQFGGVPLKLVPSTSAETYFTRNSAEEIYTQVIADFGEAYRLLPDKGESIGRINKYAAAHFLAKAHLFRASELYSDWNSNYVASDLDAVIQYGSEVVDAHPLCNDYVELWDYEQPNGANEKVSEVILAAQFSNDESTWGRYGNQMHLYYPAVYQGNDIGGCKRDISGGREFSYVSATEYTMQVFDRVNDSRFWKSFITCYGANETKSAPTWTAEDMPYAPAGVKEGDKRFSGGELGMKYIVNDPGDNRYEKYSNAPAYTVLKDGKMCNTYTYVRYFKGQEHSWNINEKTGNYYDIIPHKRSVALSKFRDGYRVSIASQFGTRDAIIARSADDVLMVAEAYIRKGEANYDKAVEWMNKLRERAGYKTGEDRSKNIDGGQAYKNNPYCSGKGGGHSSEGAIYWEENTYYESNNIEQETTASTKTTMKLNSVADVYNSTVDTPIYNELGCTSNADKMMCFLLNERTRELCGELQRWEDLARTKTLDARWHKFNDGASRGLGEFKSEKHYYRPIPQAFLDGITNSNGSALSNEEKKAIQNPGY
ncbi:Cell surface glycan-binding lipoprotein, utilization system for glycans and polysaccharides (PUL), SusD family [Bacteroides ovatus]|uniref:RagB/SusD family nutrient uptake outer membrane protein n=1 Tax=Bacteroides TaxID=816 RepID=UPI000E8124C6|nr:MULTISPECIES: RagB/SusD family nutrient uptake outer membrane protein [Bacteroides]MCS3176781.1 RagB/SusD family nutrient uptake outer membrane protein [Candidatus Bacteroides intestinigallinarum]RGN66438.1 RagB/SusD family nutrient uptake outer membrane protein [Bacteroides sp. OM05-10AA]RGQ68583.1 RagB/SusD family nutrient uptake outer membrane protein [Bacteroides sp. AF27-33]CAG9902381.1 Cell surface glycan-binding lipoprotein, utilization system for glycans and polysaccharides (PUL), Su